MSTPTDQYPVLHGTNAVMTGARKVAVITIVVCLGISALFGIGILFQGEWSDLQMKIIFTTLIFAIYSVIFLIIISFFERIGAFSFWLILISSSLSLVLILANIWYVIPDTWTREQRLLYYDVTFKIIMISTILAIYFLHISLLFLMRIRSHAAIRTTMYITFLFGTFIAVWLILLVFEVEGLASDTMLRIAAASTILIVLGTILLPILGRLIHEQHVVNRMTSIELPAGILQLLRKYAAEQNLSMPEFLGLLLEEYQENHDLKEKISTPPFSAEQGIQGTEGGELPPPRTQA